MYFYQTPNLEASHPVSTSLLLLLTLFALAHLSISSNFVTGFSPQVKICLEKPRKQLESQLMR